MAKKPTRSVYRGGKADFSNLLAEQKHRKEGTMSRNQQRRAAMAEKTAQEQRKPPELSYFRRRIMSDEKVKYVYSTDSDVIHDKTCIKARDIPDEYLVYLENYASEMSQCPKCAVKSYVRLGAKDFENMRGYERLFERMHMEDGLIRHMYVDCRMKTRVIVDTLMVWDREDIWKIVALDNEGNVQLLHNNYHLLQSGERKFARGFHVQSEYTGRTTVSVALKTIETYSFDLHKASVEEKMRQREEEQERNRVPAVQPAADLVAAKGSTKMHMPGSLWGRMQEWFRRRGKADTETSGIESYSVQIHDFRLVGEAGYPSDGEWCIYIWETKNGDHRWQNGVYDAEKGCFVISYKGVSCITNKRKVLAWKKLDDTVFGVKEK